MNTNTKEKQFVTFDGQSRTSNQIRDMLLQYDLPTVICLAFDQKLGARVYDLLINHSRLFLGNSGMNMKVLKKLKTKKKLVLWDYLIGPNIDPDSYEDINKMLEY